jgi:hypothetical protein
VLVGVGVGGAPSEAGRVPLGVGVGGAPGEVGAERALVVPGPPASDLPAGLVAPRAAGLPNTTARDCAAGWFAEANAAARPRAGLELSPCLPSRRHAPSGAAGPIVEPPGTADIPGAVGSNPDAITAAIGATVALLAIAVLITTAAANFPEDTGDASASPFNKPMIRLGAAHAIAHATARR